MPPKVKSATRSMTTYKTLCTKRVKDVADTVKEYIGKTLAQKQVERLEAICNRLVEQESRMSDSHEEFLIDKHKEIVAATTIYEETMILVNSAVFDIQIMINQAYEGLRTAVTDQDQTGTNATRGAIGSNPKPKPAKIDDTLKPKGKLNNDMTRLEATEWIKEYRAL